MSAGLEGERRASGEREERNEREVEDVNGQFDRKRDRNRVGRGEDV
jgi:hypothetical protein